MNGLEMNGLEMFASLLTASPDSKPCQCLVLLQSTASSVHSEFYRTFFSWFLLDLTPFLPPYNPPFGPRPHILNQIETVPSS